MAEYDLVIRGGTVVDGSRMPRYRADIAIKDGRIAKIGRISAHEAKRSIDAGGKIVAPGVIDLHTHYDAQVFWDPWCTISSWHGVTSAVIGNCGFGFAPVRPAERERAMQTMTRVEAIPLASMKAGMPWDWTSYPEFLESLDRTPKGINLLPYVPVAPLMIWSMGFEEAKSGRLPTDRETQEMCRLLDEAMDAGGCGWSAQRLPPTGPACVQRDFDGTPMVTDVMADETCLALAGVLGRRGEGFVQMTLFSESPKRDREHFERIAEVSGRPILFNVVQAIDRHPERHRRQLAWLERCRAQGLRVYGQGFTTDAGFTFKLGDWNLFDDSAPWREVTLGTIEERRAKMADPSRRPALRERLPNEGTVTSSFGEILIATIARAENKHLEGLSLDRAAEVLGKHPADVFLDLALSEDLETEFFAPASGQSLELIRELLDDDYILFGVSDGGAHTKFLTAGRYPTEAIVRFVREREWMTLEDIHFRLSALPAFCAGLKNRGVLREGAPADILVYDLDKLEVLPTEIAHDLPAGEWRRVQKSNGYDWIIVNGVPTFENGRSTGETPGSLLRHGGG